MKTKHQKPDLPRKRGRPETRVIKIDATPDKAARVMFSGVKKPDPPLRVKPK